MLRQRVIVAIVLLPIGMAVIYFGGIGYIFLIALLLGFASWEYGQLFRTGGFKPADFFVIGGTLAFVATRSLRGDENITWLVALIIFASMVYHLLAYERGRDSAGSDFAITITGALYIGFLGSYLILLRDLPQGAWWVLLTLPAVWFADSGAYFYGKRFGQRPLCSRLSPRKTWEGYFAGIVISVLGTALFGSLWRLPAGPESGITILRGALLGLTISVITPLGDLGESMIKRQVGVKDSSALIPGHGGVFDRIDSWLWAGVIGYYLIVWFFI